MKLGIVGTGNVACASAPAAVTRGGAREIVLVNRTRKTAEAVATDLRYGAPLSPKVDIRDGEYGDLTGCGAVLDRADRSRVREWSKSFFTPPESRFIASIPSGLGGTGPSGSRCTLIHAV